MLQFVNTVCLFSIFHLFILYTNRYEMVVKQKFTVKSKKATMSQLKTFFNKYYTLSLLNYLMLLFINAPEKEQKKYALETARRNNKWKVFFFSVILNYTPKFLQKFCNRIVVWTTYCFACKLPISSRRTCISFECSCTR